MPLAQQLTTDLQRRIFGIAVEDLRKMCADARNELADLRVEFNRLQQEVLRLRQELAESRDGDRPLEEMTLDEILSLHPGCREALERFEIEGGGERTLAQAARDAEAEVETLVATIKNLLKDQAAA